MKMRKWDKLKKYGHSRLLCDIRIWIIVKTSMTSTNSQQNSNNDSERPNASISGILADDGIVFRFLFARDGMQSKATRTFLKPWRRSSKVLLITRCLRRIAGSSWTN